MKQAKLKLITAMLAIAFAITFILSVLIPYSTTAFADREIAEKQSFEIDKEKNEGTFCENNGLELENTEFFDDSNIENDIFESLKIPSDCVFNISSSTQNILNSLLSEEDFVINGTVTSYNGTVNINDYYNFADSNKFEIADWAWKADLISYEEKIESYCDLIIDRNFNNVTCLENFIDEIRIYSDTIECSSFQDKINTVIEPRSSFYDNVFNDSISLLALSNVSTYSSDKFLVHYDSSATSRTEAVNVANYFETIRTKYLNFGFNSPILENSQSRYRVYMDPANNGSTLAATFKVNVSGNTCASYIYLYNYKTLDDLMRESIAHEYFHAIQNSYNHQSGWFKEACANWGAVNTCTAYPNSISWIRSFINNSTNVSMPSLSGYAAVVFPLTIQKNYGGTSTIRNIYEEYSKYSESIDFSTLTMVVSDGIVRSGYSNNFKDAYRSMATFMLRPQVWLNTVMNTSSLFNLTVKNTWIVSTSTQTFNGSLDYFSSTYSEIKLPSSVSAGNVKINVTFSNCNGSVQTYTIDNNNEHQILYPQTSASGISNIERTDIGSEINKLYVVLSNTDYSSSIDYTVTVWYSTSNDMISISSNTRYFEGMCYISDGGYKEYSVNFATAGLKIIQTFCSYDTKVELYDASGALLVENDDRGYSLNGLICYQASANTNYKIRVYYYSSSVNGYTKLSITPANGALKSGKTSLSFYTNIYALDRSSNVSWTSGFEQNYVKMITYNPNISGNYIFDLTSTYDNYLYVIDPRNNEMLIQNVDYNDDGGNGLNARLTKYLVEGVDYLVICSKYNPGTSLSSTDNSEMQLHINQTGLATYSNNPKYLKLSLVARSGFIIYNWDVKISNPNSFAVQVTYNSKMCFQSDAKNYTGLKDLVTVIIPGNSSVTVRINGNGTAGWITTCIDYSCDSANYRRVTCANGLSGNLTMNTPFNHRISY